MSQIRGAYAHEFPHQIVELARVGRKPSELAQEFGCHGTSINTWARQAKADQIGGGRPDAPLTTAEHQALVQLRCHFRQVPIDRRLLPFEYADQHDCTVPGQQRYPAWREEVEALKWYGPLKSVITESARAKARRRWLKLKNSSARSRCAARNWKVFLLLSDPITHGENLHIFGKTGTRWAAGMARKFSPSSLHRRITCGPC